MRLPNNRFNGIRRNGMINDLHSESTLETKRLLLRRLTTMDASDLFQTVGDPLVMKYWLGGADTSIQATERRIAQIEAHWHRHRFGDWGVVDKKSGKLVGFSGLHYIADMAEVNIGNAFARATWRQGFGFEAGQAVLEFGFQELNLSSIVAVIWPENLTSINLAKKLGLKFWKAFMWQGRERVAYKICRDESPPRDKSHG